MIPVLPLTFFATFQSDIISQIKDSRKNVKHVALPAYIEDTVQLHNYLPQSLECHCSCHGFGMLLVGTRCLGLVVDTINCDLRETKQKLFCDATHWNWLTNLAGTKLPSFRTSLKTLVGLEIDGRSRWCSKCVRRGRYNMFIATMWSGVWIVQKADYGHKKRANIAFIFHFTF